MLWVARRRNAVQVQVHRGAIVCNVCQSISEASLLRRRALHHCFPFAGARAENADRARALANRPAPLHPEPSPPGLFGSVAAKFAADTTHLLPACAMHENSPPPDHQSPWRALADRACKFYIRRCKSVSNPARPVATPSDVLSLSLIVVSRPFANQRMPRKNFRARAPITPRCGESIYPNFLPLYYAA